MEVGEAHLFRDLALAAGSAFGSLAGSRFLGRESARLCSCSGVLLSNASMQEH